MLSSIGRSEVRTLLGRGRIGRCGEGFADLVDHGLTGRGARCQRIVVGLALFVLTGSKRLVGESDCLWGQRDGPLSISEAKEGPGRRAAPHPRLSRRAEPLRCQQLRVTP